MKTTVVLTLCLAMLMTGCGGGGGTPPEAEPPPATYTLSGTITAATGTAVDSDTNDSDAPYIPNDDIGQQQPIPNPVILGGFVTAQPTGSSGDRFEVSADPADVFEITLVAGQVIELAISDWDLTAADLDLYLVDAADPANPVVIDASVGLGATESLTVPAGGTFLVVVDVFAGTSNYVLTVGNVTSTALETKMRLSTAFVPGEAIVRLKQADKPQAVELQVTPMAQLQALGFRTKAGSARRAMLMQLPGPAAAIATRNVGPVMKMPLWRAGLTALQEERLRTIRMLKSLKQNKSVESAELNYLVWPQLVPNDSQYPLQWHYPMINLPQAWDLTTGTSANGEVVAAVIDTGIYLDHPDLQGQLVPGYDFISDPDRALDGDGIDADPDDPGTDVLPGASIWHGTHVAGILAASTNNTVGVAGVAWGAKIMPLRAVGFGAAGTIYDIMQAIRFAAGLPNDSGTSPAQAAGIINISLGCLNCYVQELQDLLIQIRDAGIITVAAAGNEGTSSPSYPGAYDGVISVAALDPAGAPAAYSNYGASIDIAAPGGDGSRSLDNSVRSTWVDDSSGTRKAAYASLDGTSTAAPHVAGVAALMKAIYPGLTPDDIDSLLISGLMTTDQGAAGRDDRYGWGTVDALRAVHAAQDLAAGGGVSPGVLIATPNSLNFTNSTTNLSLTVSKAGDTPVAVSSLSAGASWLTVTPLAVDPDGLGTYSANVDRAGLTDATYTARITLASSNNTALSIPVTMRVGSQAVADAGHLWVLLFDENLEPVAQTDALPVNGRYSYSLPVVPEGNYIIGAGTDSDNDFSICDEGEACGAYPTLIDPAVIAVSSDRSGLDFVTGFLSFTTESSATGATYTGAGFGRVTEAANSSNLDFSGAQSR
ncbi:MAG: S8 family peptidase [Halobacteria archaeon]|nr:S8 family peptidase [Halobacteria archaeon]